MRQKWRQLSWRDRGLLLEAAVLSVGVWLCLRIFPFRYLAPYLGREVTKGSPVAGPTRPSEMVARISWAVQAVGSRLAWSNLCLVNAVAAKLMLRRRGISTQLFLGLAKDGEQNLEAHAWLNCGDLFVTGETDHERFVVMTSFVD
ncbi:MAG: lasso peptide biosynthesis B2 protein [Ardenticatenaceae bacterium]|nr:lasso peptide biosynthesis B2 protein [Ardenticatenaceae bacterium]